MPKSPNVDTPSNEPFDTLETEVSEHPFTFRGDERVAALVVEAVNLMGGFGEGAEDRYQRQLGVLREQGDEVLRLISDAYSRLTESAYVDRWSLIQLLADLESPAATGALKEFLAEEIPEERSRDPHSFSTVAEEVMIRTTAVEALARVAAGGDPDAIDVLHEQVRHPQFSVRRAAVQALVATGDRRVLERLREELRETDELRLLDIKRIDVTEAPQATGGLFLARPGTDERDEPPPHDLTGRQPI